MIAASIVLADFAEQDSVTGKAHILGAGWTITGPSAVPHAVVVFLKLSPDYMGQTLQVQLRLTDQAGQLVKIPSPTGEQEMEIVGQLQLKDSEDWQREVDAVDSVFSLNVAAIQLQPGHSYTWTADVDSKPVASTTFRVRLQEPDQPVT
jgi:hypothetical protein